MPDSTSQKAAAEKPQHRQTEEGERGDDLGQQGGCPQAHAQD
jgi:hypothetical protein